MTSAESPQRNPNRGDALAGLPWETRRPALRSLFEDISPRYDLLNRCLSLGLDGPWRDWAVAELGDKADGVVLDLASGTGEMVLRLRGRGRGMALRGDLSPGLLVRGREKWLRGRRDAKTVERPSPGLACEMESLPLRDASVDAVVQGFALRHCRGFDSLFAELHRVLAPGGRISLLDMRYPRTGFASGLYRFYFRKVLPRLAGLLGGDRAAYELMVESVRNLPSEEELLAALARAGFVEARSRPGFWGAVRLLTARRPDSAAC